MEKKLKISVQSDLKELIEDLKGLGHDVITSHEVSHDISIFIISNIDEDWEQLRSLEWMHYDDNKFFLTINASKLTKNEILEVIQKIGEKNELAGQVAAVPENPDVLTHDHKPKKIKVSVEEELIDVKKLLIDNGYEVIPSHKLDGEVAAIVFTGVDEVWETIFTYEMRQYGAKYVLTMNASNMKPEEVLEVINRLCIQ
ncbi:YkuS family protein [Geosporobacter ferrireducens]|uniref:Uncharacterized protein n=1 Tax=Geosporobacter ferrireducens TaxID=1424294 RepID=A0A1D8GP75_9FIRM|nr:YkuS family protein [Geosporobacter ferrireducens]AOT72667.1 hypothetical protein Gferi_25800 [Geosporobacter ferrireducens]MTI55073.1 hypothetical protein [Geosporobacter ferrireducens]